MQLRNDISTAHYQITGFEPGLITINNSPYKKNLIISPNHLIDNWFLGELGDLDEPALLKIVALKPEVILIGTGNVHPARPILTQLAPLYKLGFHVETMTTVAACRTYTALCAQDRMVAAGLLIK